MKETIRQNASLEALSKKSFKKYLKMLIKTKHKYLDNSQRNPHAYPYFDRVHAEYSILCQVYDDYVYHKARKKNKKDKGHTCRI